MTRAISPLLKLDFDPALDLELVKKKFRLSKTNMGQITFILTSMNNNSSSLEKRVLVNKIIQNPFGRSKRIHNLWKQTLLKIVEELPKNEGSPTPITAKAKPLPFAKKIIDALASFSVGLGSITRRWV